MTGRGAGFCAGYGVPGYTNRGYGSGGAVFGGHGGRGRRNRFFATDGAGRPYFAGNPIPGGMTFTAPPETPRNEMDVLKGQAQYLEKGLKELQARMEALASKNKTE